MTPRRAEVAILAEGVREMRRFQIRWLAAEVDGGRCRWIAELRRQVRAGAYRIPVGELAGKLLGVLEA